MPIPKYIRLELKDSDVERDIIGILQSMEQLRLDALLNRSINELAEKKYGVLASELAADLDALRSYDAQLKEKLNAVVSELGKENLLLKYDPLQDLFWKKKMPCFLKTLDMILFRFLNVDIDTIDKKHHIMQALKCMIKPDSEANITLEPTLFNGAVDISALVSEIGLKNSLGRIGIESLSNTTLLLRNPERHNLDEVFYEAKKLGYLYMWLIVNAEEYLGNKILYPGYPIKTDAGFSNKMASQKKSQAIVTLENRLQTIESSNCTDMAYSLHELLKEIKEKSGSRSLSSIMSSLIGNKKFDKGTFSERNSAFAEELSKKDMSYHDCIISRENIGKYERIRIILLRANTAYLVSSISENGVENAAMLRAMSAAEGSKDKIMDILSHPDIYCARLIKFNEDKLVESYEAVK